MMAQDKELYTVKAIMLFVLIFPGFYKYAELKVEQLITIVAFFLCVFALFKYMLKMSKETYGIAIVYMVIYLFIIIISLIRGSEDFVNNDLVEITKPFFFLSFFLLAFTVVWDIEKLENLLGFFLKLCIFLVFFGYFESLTSIGNTIALNLYKPNRDVLEGKAVGPFIITYAFATFLVLPFYCLLTRYFFSRSWFNKYLVLSLLVLGCIFLTQSKTVFLAIIISLLLFFIICPLYSGIPGRRKIFSFGIGVILTCIISFTFIVSFFESNFSYIYSGLEVLTRFLKDDGIMAALNSNTSTRNRLEQLVFALDNQDSLPLIGVGIGKGTFMPESFYALYLYRVGLIGIILHFILLIFSLKISLNNAKKLIAYGNINLSSFFLGFHFYIVALPFCYFSAAVNDQTRTGFIMYFFIAVNIAVNNMLKRGYNENNINNHT